MRIAVVRDILVSDYIAQLLGDPLAEHEHLAVDDFVGIIIVHQRIRHEYCLPCVILRLLECSIGEVGEIVIHVTEPTSTPADVGIKQDRLREERIQGE